MWSKIIKSILSKKIICIIIVFQLVQLFNSIFEIKEIYSKYNVFYSNMRELNIDSDKIGLFQIKNTSLNNNLVNSLAGFKNEAFKREYGLGNTITHAFRFEKLNNNDIQEKSRDLYYKYRTDYEVLYRDSLEIILVDYGILKMLNLSITDGVGITKDDYREYSEEESIPIILSEEYKDYFKLQEEIYHEAGERKYKVIGFYNKNAKWFNKINPYMAKYDSLGNNAIMPLVQNDKFSSLNTQVQIYSGLLCEINSEEEKDEIIKLAANYDLDATIVKLSDIDRTIKTNIQSSVKEIIVFFLLLFLVICISVSSILIYIINDRKYFLGIERVNGATNIYLSKLIVYELFILFGISFFISMYLRYRNLIELRFSYIVNDCLIGLILSLIMISIISIFPIRNLVKKSIVQLLR